ncbi:MAG: hypothetical protein IPP36_03465 [Nitrosomonadales bacterium]|nr:hypothetical protein [Nitrosomonadales bacterium]
MAKVTVSCSVAAGVTDWSASRHNRAPLRFCRWDGAPHLIEKQLHAVGIDVWQDQGISSPLLASTRVGVGVLMGQHSLA